MAVQCALKNFKGKGDRGKLNCAQAVAAAFPAAAVFSEDLIDDLGNAGGGKAEGGRCGAYHAASLLAETEDVREQLKSVFEDGAGSVFCREIRGMKSWSCSMCVEKAAEVLDRSLKGCS